MKMGFTCRVAYLRGNGAAREPEEKRQNVPPRRREPPSCMGQPTTLLGNCGCCAQLLTLRGKSTPKGRDALRSESALFVNAPGPIRLRLSLCDQMHVAVMWISACCESALTSSWPHVLSQRKLHNGAEGPRR